MNNQIAGFFLCCNVGMNLTWWSVGFPHYFHCSLKKKKFKVKVIFCMWKFNCLVNENWVSAQVKLEKYSQYMHLFFFNSKKFKLYSFAFMAGLLLMQECHFFFFDSGKIWIVNLRLFIYFFPSLSECVS